MSRRLAEWSALRLGRRRFLGGVLTTVFGIAAGLATGRLSAEASQSCPCSGPFNSGSCGSSFCNGSHCQNFGFTTCSLTNSYCPTSGCWSCNGQTCCDCFCNGGGSTWYCYCAG